VDDRIATGDQLIERGGVVQRSCDPVEALAGRLRPACEGTNRVTGSERLLKRRTAYETGGAGDGQPGQSSTI